MLICPIDNRPVYIGKTIYSLEERLSKHISKTKTKIKYNRKLSRSESWIKKLLDISIYDKIKIELVEECDIDIINEREIFWISEFRKTHKLKNLTDGGDGGLGYKHTPEELEKMSINRRGKCVGKDHHNFGKEIGKEPWFKLTDLMKSDENPNIGKECKEATKLKISKANSGENNGMFGRRMKRTDVQKEKLSRSLKNSDKLKSSRKSEEYKSKISNHFSKPILVLDMDFNIVHEFKNCKLCANHFGYTNSNIANAIRYYRIIGKGRVTKFWIVRKDSYEISVNKIKESLT